MLAKNKSGWMVLEYLNIYEEEIVNFNNVMQSTFTLYDDSSITLTVARYNPPSGVNYDGVGVTPDEHVENTEGDVDAQLLRGYEILREKLGIS